MQFTAEQYYRVSLERMKQARRLYQDGAAYSLAMYCGGLAVESLLRAFRWSADTSFEGRHDLSELLNSTARECSQKSGFLGKFERSAKMAAAGFPGSSEQPALYC